MWYVTFVWLPFYVRRYIRVAAILCEMLHSSGRHLVWSVTFVWLPFYVRCYIRVAAILCEVFHSVLDPKERKGEAKIQSFPFRQILIFIGNSTSANGIVNHDAIYNNDIRQLTTSNFIDSQLKWSSKEVYITQKVCKNIIFAKYVLTTVQKQRRNLRMVFTFICSYFIYVPVTNTRLTLQRRITINWKGYGRDGLWPNATSNLTFTWKNWWRPRTTWAKIVGGTVALRTENLQNTSHRR